MALVSSAVPMYGEPLISRASAPSLVVADIIFNGKSSYPRSCSNSAYINGISVKKQSEKAASGGSGRQGSKLYHSTPEEPIRFEDSVILRRIHRRTDQHQ